MIIKTIRYFEEKKEIVITYKVLGITIYQKILSTDGLRFSFRSISV